MNPRINIPGTIAFEGDRRIAAGELRDVVRAAKETLERHKNASILVFDGNTGKPIDIDFRGTVDDVLARLPQNASSSTCRGKCRARAAAEPRSGPSEIGRGCAGNHLAAKTLGLAGATDWRRVGCDPQTGRGGAADRR